MRISRALSRFQSLSLIAWRLSALRRLLFGIVRNESPPRHACEGGDLFVSRYGLVPRIAAGWPDSFSILPVLVTVVPLIARIDTSDVVKLPT